MNGIDEMPWDGSQSGRRKQNFGPKTNFKKMKLAVGPFEGFPAFTKFVQTKFESEPLLRDFKTVEQCSLEYDDQKGACIDPHIDDCWVWGERVVTVNCLGDSVLTLSRYNGDDKRYNLCLVDKYRSALLAELLDESELNKFNDLVIRIPMPARSLIVLYGPARYQFEHCVLREDINHRRVCLAYREFTTFYLCDGEKYDSAGKDVLNKAKLYWDHSTREGGVGMRK
ncbi:hypothetical protein HA402_006119 [Bradysia odoriphaga]|nr:hypothetical protein HA402_006119 [Bradysia odoriphaga]